MSARFPEGLREQNILNEKKVEAVQWGEDILVNDSEEEAQSGGEARVLDDGNAGSSDDHLKSPELTGDGVQPWEADMPRIVKSPRTPTPLEIDEHELTHCPPRSWCGWCVRD